MGKDPSRLPERLTDLCFRGRRLAESDPGRVKTANSLLLSSQPPHQASEGRKFLEAPATWAAFRCSYSQAPPTNWLDAEFSHGLDPFPTFVS